MADDRIVLEVDVKEASGKAGDMPSPRAARERYGARVTGEYRRRYDEERRRASGWLNRWRRTSSGVFTDRFEPDPLELQGTTRERLRQRGVFLGTGQRQDQPTSAQYRDMATKEMMRRYGMGMGGGGGGGRGYGRGGGGGGGSRRFHPGQVFQTGIIGRMFGLRAAGLATAGFAGAAFLMVDQALNRLVQTVKGLNAAYQNQIEQLRGLSPALTMAGAERKVRTTMTRLRLAQEYGPEFADTYRAQTEFRMAVMEFMAEFSRLVGPALEFFARTGALTVGGLTKLMELADEDWALFFSAFIPGNPLGLLHNLKLMNELLKKMAEPEEMRKAIAAMASEEAFFANPEAVMNAKPDTAVTPFPDHLR